MTGLRPDGLGIYDLPTFFRDKAPDVVTLSQYFMQQGYQAEGMGKIYHQGHGNRDDSLSWSIPHWNPHRLINQREPINSGDTAGLHTSYPSIDGKRIPWYSSRLPEELHNDPLYLNISEYVKLLLKYIPVYKRAHELVIELIESSSKY